MTLAPSIFTLPHLPHPTNSHPTATLDEQFETEGLISDVLKLIDTSDTSDSTGAETTSELELEPLRKGDHVKYVCSTMNYLSAPYVSLDASRPWLLFWTMHSLDLLGCALDDETKKRAISTLLHFQAPSGGFAGGPANTQNAHLLPTYGSICTLAMVGRPGPGGGWEELAGKRQEMYDFFMRCKRPDGGFVVCEGGELDVRGTYCLLVVATLLDIITPELIHNVDKFIAACQTYEGGFACSSFPFANENRAAQAEAHGGYTSCALNSYFLLSTILPPSTSTSTSLGEFPVPIDVDAALRWSVLQQGEAIEAGGFRGRSNKLVDGCYSWWVGGGVPVVEALARRGKEDKEEEVHPPLFNPVALQEFILLAAQKETGGGLRDKPGKRPDLYHTCNNLSGLSIAQHPQTHSRATVESNRASFDTTKGLPAIRPTTPGGGWKDEEERQAVRKEIWANALGWIDNGPEIVLGGKASRLNTTTPVFNILGLRLKPFINYFYGQQ